MNQRTTLITGATQGRAAPSRSTLPPGGRIRVLLHGRDSLKTGAVTAVQQNTVASGGKVERDGAAQALGGAGDQSGALVHALTLAAQRRGRGE